MRNNSTYRRTLIVSFTFILLIIIVGCGANHHSMHSANSGANPTTITIIDTAGRSVTIEQPIERIAILDNGTAEVFSALGVLERIVGNHLVLSNQELFPTLQDVPVVATYSEVNYEKLAEVSPQVVFSSIRAHGVVDEQAHLQSFNMKDVKLNLRNPEYMKEEIILLGKLFEKEQKAQEIVDFYKHYEQLIASRIAEVPQEQRPLVFVESHAGDFHTGGPGSRFYEQVILAGAINLAAELTGEPQVSDEWVAEQNPDVIIREATGFGYEVFSDEEVQSIREEILNRPALAQTEAIHNKAVYLISVDRYSRPGYIVGVSYLAKWLYPQLFEDFDPKEVEAQYMALFHPNMPIQGLWVYDGREGE